MRNDHFDTPDDFHSESNGFINSLFHKRNSRKNHPNAPDDFDTAGNDSAKNFNDNKDFRFGHPGTVNDYFDDLAESVFNNPDTHSWASSPGNEAFKGNSYYSNDSRNQQSGTSGASAPGGGDSGGNAFHNGSQNMNYSSPPPTPEEAAALRNLYQHLPTRFRDLNSKEKEAIRNLFKGKKYHFYFVTPESRKFIKHFLEEEGGNFDLDLLDDKEPVKDFSHDDAFRNLNTDKEWNHTMDDLFRRLNSDEEWDNFADDFFGSLSQNHENGDAPNHNAMSSFDDKPYDSNFRTKKTRRNSRGAVFLYVVIAALIVIFVFAQVVDKGL